MVDATIIEQSTGAKRDDGSSTRDEDASFTKKHGATHHGYKGHIACDLSGIVTDYRFTTAKEHDSKRIDELTVNERAAVYADSAYSDRARRAELTRRGVIDVIISKRVRGQAELRDWQKRWNKLVSCARTSGASVRNVETTTWLSSGSLSRLRTERVRLRADADGMQH